MKQNFIPTINISSLINKNLNSKKSQKIIKKIEKACVEVGFFQVIGHGIDHKKIKKIVKIGEKFFKLNKKEKIKLSPNKWNKKNKNFYRGYFPSDVNGKEGLDIGDLRVSDNFSQMIKNQYIEYLNLEKCFQKNSIGHLSNYYDDIYFKI